MQVTIDSQVGVESFSTAKMAALGHSLAPPVSFSVPVCASTSWLTAAMVN